MFYLYVNIILTFWSFFLEAIWSKIEKWKVLHSALHIVDIFFFTKFGQVRPTQVNLFEVKYLKWKDNKNKQADQECVCRGLYRH